MKVLFINALLGGDFSAMDIAITSLATYLNERTQHKAAILDLTFHTRHWQKHIRHEINAFNPDIIAISCNTLYMQYVRRIVYEIKTKYNLPVITGGYHASIKPEDVINIDGVDAVCIGDGEYVLTEYLNRFEKGKSMKSIAGLWAKENGGIIRNPGGSFIQDIDSLPIPNWDLWKDLDKYFYYLGMLYLIGTRGCPYKCTYCDAHGVSKAVNGPYYRVRDPVKYAQEIAYQYEKYKHRGVRLAQLFDQVFTLDKKWLKKFTDEYRNLGLADEFKFSAFARIDNLDRERAEMLGKGGCALLRVGIEAGNEYIRNEIYKKNITNAQVREVFEICRKNGIGFTAFYILGGPAETRDTINETIKMAMELNANRSAFFIYKPFTEEGLNQIIQHGGVIDQKRWEKADNITFDAVIKLKDLTPKQIEALQRKAYFLTFGKRLLWMIKRQKLRYFTQFASYMASGIKDGLDVHYLLPYFHIYSYDNVDK